MVNRTKFEKVRLLAFGFLVVVCLFPADGFAQGFLPHMSESSPVKPENLTQQQKAALPNRVLTGQGTVGESPAPSAEPIPAHAPPEPKPEASRIEKILSGEFPTEISRQLRQFGYDFFQRDTTAFEPVTAIPVGDDYVIGPRDEFTIYLWGKVEAAYPVTVTREGSILVPRLGSINVAGLTFAELKHLLAAKFREYYPQFEMSVTMGTLRTIGVFLVGEANRPGTYSVHSLSTLVSALYGAGGPSKNGSLRNIQLNRNGKTVATLDLYDFFIRGDKKMDLRLQNEDTVFIPVLGSVAGIAGNVRRPAIYELKGATTVGQLIELAGGVMPTGYLQHVVVQRIKGHQRRQVVSFNLDPTGPSYRKDMATPLQDGDLIQIFPVHETLRQVVYLKGHVKYPGEYEWKPGIRVGDVVGSYENLLPEPYLPRAEIIRRMQPDLHPEILAFDLGALLGGDDKENLILQDLDQITVYSMEEKTQKPVVSIRGAVLKPGAYPLFREMRVRDLIFAGGNLTNRAFREDAVLFRVVPGKPMAETERISFSPEKAMAGTGSDNLPLHPEDQVFIREIPQYTEALQRKVTLEGEFLFPGEHAFSSGEKLRSAIEKAGGLTPGSYPYGAVFQRESVKEVQKARLREYIEKLEEDVLTLSVQAAETTADKDQAAALQQSLSARKQLLEKLKTAQPTGRMVIDLASVLQDPASSHNFEVRPGDRLIVGKTPDYVNVLGEVYNPTALFAEREKTVEYYLNRVGGATKDADTGQTYLVRANGSVISRSQESFLGLPDPDTGRWWTMSGFESLRLEPGDSIIVPRKLEKYPWLGITKDITQILYQIAVAAGVIIVAY
jgi:protein involved in polysaccharide export with SLBB domain